MSSIFQATKDNFDIVVKEKPRPEPLRANLLSQGEQRQCTQAPSSLRTAEGRLMVAFPEPRQPDDSLVRPAQPCGQAVFVIPPSSPGLCHAALPPSDNFWAGKRLGSPGRGCSINEGGCNSYSNFGPPPQQALLQSSHCEHGFGPDLGPAGETGAAAN